MDGESNSDRVFVDHLGLRVRDLFAGIAMHALIQNKYVHIDPASANHLTWPASTISVIAYSIADGMLEARKVTE